MAKNNDEELENEEMEEKGPESGDINPDSLEDALGGDDAHDEFEEDDSDGVYLKPKNSFDEDEEDIDMPFDDNESEMWKL